MPRNHTSSFRIEFGDCDPAQIVFYPNYFKWMDIAALHFFNACGIDSWRETKAERGIIGAPLLSSLNGHEVQGDEGWPQRKGFAVLCVWKEAWCVLIELWHTPKIAGLSGICERINHQP